MRLYAGCYERFLFGYEIADKDGSQCLEQVLSIPAHKRVVKCIDTCGDLVVTGGGDDQLHLFNMKTSADLGFLVNPAEGAVPCIAFVKPDTCSTATHLLSGSVGGEICVWRAEGEWEYIKSMTGHKSIVNSIATHPSGALAISASRDKQMRLWDLRKGKCAYQAPLRAEGDILGFFNSGNMYFVSSSDPSKAGGSVISLHSTEGVSAGSIQHDRRVLAVGIHGENTIVVGCDGGDLFTWDARSTGKHLSVTKAHGSRVRALTKAFSLPGHASPFMASASSDGVVKIWNLQSLSSDDASSVASAETNARFTCLCSFEDCMSNRKKQKKKKSMKVLEDIEGIVSLNSEQKNNSCDDEPPNQVKPRLDRNICGNEGTPEEEPDNRQKSKAHEADNQSFHVARTNRADLSISNKSSKRSANMKSGQGVKKKRKSKSQFN